MTTCQELLKRHRDLGRRRDFHRILFEGLWDRNWCSLESLRKYCVDRVYGLGGRFDAVIDFLDCLGYLKRRPGEVALTKNARKHLATAQQSRKLSFEPLVVDAVRACERDKVLGYVFPSLELEDLSTDVKVTFPIAAVPLRFLPLQNAFRELGLLEVFGRPPLRVQICPHLTQWFLRDICKKIELEAESTGVSANELRRSLKLQERIGRQAEEFIVRHERRIWHGHPAIDLIRRISDSDVTAGYDVRSFDDWTAVTCNRLIEVKSVDSSLTFFWTANEVSTAKTTADQYILALVERHRMDSMDYEPIYIRNPFSALIKCTNERIISADLTMSVDTWRIQLSPAFLAST